MKKRMIAMSSLCAVSLLITGCSADSGKSSTTTTTTSENESSQEVKNVSKRNKVLRAMDENEPSDKEYTLSLPFDKEKIDEEHNNQFKISLAFKTEENTEEESSSRKKKNTQEDEYVYDALDGNNKRFVEVLQAFEPIMNDENNNNIRSFEETVNGQNVTWTITQEEYPEVAQQIDTIFREHYAELDDDFNKQVKDLSQDVFDHFGM